MVVVGVNPCNLSMMVHWTLWRRLVLREVMVMRSATMPPSMSAVSGSFGETDSRRLDRSAACLSRASRSRM